MTQSKSHPKRRQRTVHSETTWRHHIDQWSDSGLSQSVYCEQHDLRVGSFSKWKSKLDKKNVGRHLSPFIPVTIKPDPTPLMLEIQFSGDVILKIPSDTNPDVVIPWINALRQVS